MPLSRFDNRSEAHLLTYCSTTNIFPPFVDFPSHPSLPISLLLPPPLSHSILNPPLLPSQEKFTGHSLVSILSTSHRVIFSWTVASAALLVQGVGIGRQEVGVGFGHWDGLRAALAGGGGAPGKGELRGGDGGGGEGGRRGAGDARMGRGEESVEGDEGGAHSTYRKVMGRRTRRVAECTSVVPSCVSRKIVSCEKWKVGRRKGREMISFELYLRIRE